MEKILGLILASIYILWLFTTQKPIEHLNKNELTSIIAQQHSINIQRSQEDIAKIITYIGESNGWIITKFKKNTLIAEKILDKNTISATITFSNSSFNVTPENVDLEKALNKALNI